MPASEPPGAPTDPSSSSTEAPDSASGRREQTIRGARKKKNQKKKKKVRCRASDSRRERSRFADREPPTAPHESSPRREPATGPCSQKPEAGPTLKPPRRRNLRVGFPPPHQQVQSYIPFYQS